MVAIFGFSTKSEDEMKQSYPERVEFIAEVIGFVEEGIGSLITRSAGMDSVLRPD
jgi:hypothetical protein